MDYSKMRPSDTQGHMDSRRQSHQHTTRYSGHWDAHSNTSAHGASHHRPSRDSTGSAAGSGYSRPSPTKKEQKHVVFQLIDPEDPRIQARLPMRVMISPHDTTESIITTVKNFYGLYEYGVSFENRDGISIIAAFDNFENDMVVYVRTVAQPPSAHNERTYPNSPSKPTLGAPIEMRASHLNNVHSPSRSAARNARRSRSPQSEYARRSVSAAPAKNNRTKSKSKDNSVHDDADGYSSDDGANGSVTSSRRSRTEQVNAEISVNNIVEGGRRQRAFESSELPLFVPPQVPMTASISSVSPQRRNGPAVTPYAYPNQQTFSYTQPLPSPQSHGSGHYQQNGASAMSYGAYPQPPRQLRGARPSNTVFPPPRLSGDGILPTPDPTVNSVISDEDVALQLMRLGDASNFSHGRTSTSTLDDALSGKAEAPSSDEEDEEAEGEVSGLPAVPSWPKKELGPQRKKQRMHEPGSDGTTGDEYEDQRDGSFKGDSDEVMPDIDGQRRQSKPAIPRPRSTMPAALKSAKPRTSSMVKPKMKPSGHSHSHSHTQAKVPMSPASLPSQSRKTSAASTINFQHALGTDEEDLSSKPRCQRCRKSKKGCDRQRPCGRCKDAGIGIEGCISEDEGNGRKGRYGRHMGVPVKRGEEGFIEPEGSVPPMSLAAAGGGGNQSMPNGGYFLAPAPVNKEKKRKR